MSQTWIWRFYRLCAVVLLVLLVLAAVLFGLTRGTRAGHRASLAEALADGPLTSSLDYLTGVPVCAQAENLVPNPEFEQGIGCSNHWCRDGECCDFYAVTSTAHSGVTSALIYAGIPIPQKCALRTVSDDVSVVPDQYYHYSAWVKTQLFQGKAELRVRFWSLEGDPPVWTPRGLVHTDQVGGFRDWSRVTGSVRAPSGAQYARVEATLVHGSKGMAWFDDVYLGLATCLEISKSHVPARAEPGQPLTYTIAYSNTGEQVAENVWVLETYDNYVTFGWASPPPLSGTTNVWRIPTLPPGSNGLIGVVVTVDHDTGDVAWLKNTVQILSHEPAIEPVPATVLIPVDGNCAVEIEPQSQTPLVGRPGEQVDHPMVLWNRGCCRGDATVVTTSLRGWPITLVPAPPYSLDSGTSTNVTLRTTIPPSEAEGVMDVASITATLACEAPCNPSAVYTCGVQTRVLPPRVDSGYLPLVTRGFSPPCCASFPDGWEQDDTDNDNSACERANGPLCPGCDLFGRLNDAWDYFYLDLHTSGVIRVVLDIHDPDDEVDMQLQLLDEQCSGDLPYDPARPFEIIYPNAEPGRYHIAVFRESDYSFDNPYTLRVTFP
jgi:uncharacterized repeat protein (TIGR01451 family)